MISTEEFYLPQIVDEHDDEGKIVIVNSAQEARYLGKKLFARLDVNCAGSVQLCDVVASISYKPGEVKWIGEAFGVKDGESFTADDMKAFTEHLFNRHRTLIKSIKPQETAIHSVQVSIIAMSLLVPPVLNC
jgi:hypothetical protein